ncbi:hypothetical protein BaRGS_00037375 [Batillaria attramentaria]|uniref:Uncharacterized protein n=1 Tax=Batillaria attramentaria TaxID=370345 RepID=A0ABD0J9A6_9CAEN
MRLDEFARHGSHEIFWVSLSGLCRWKQLTESHVNSVLLKRRNMQGVRSSGGREGTAASGITRLDRMHCSSCSASGPSLAPRWHRGSQPRAILILTAGKVCSDVLAVGFPVA